MRHIRHEYAILSSVMAFLRNWRRPISTGLLATDYVQNYTESYYLVDTYYRRICANYNKLENPIIGVGGSDAHGGISISE